MGHYPRDRAWDDVTQVKGLSVGGHINEWWVGVCRCGRGAWRVGVLLPGEMVPKGRDPYAKPFSFSSAQGPFWICKSAAASPPPLPSSNLFITKISNIYLSRENSKMNPHVPITIIHLEKWPAPSSLLPHTLPFLRWLLKLAHTFF